MGYLSAKFKIYFKTYESLEEHNDLLKLNKNEYNSNSKKYDAEIDECKESITKIVFTIFTIIYLIASLYNFYSSVIGIIHSLMNYNGSTYIPFMLLYLLSVYLSRTVLVYVMIYCVFLFNKSIYHSKFLRFSMIFIIFSFFLSYIDLLLTLK